MKNPLRALVKTEQREIVSVDDYITALNQFAYSGFSYGFGGAAGINTQQTLAAHPVEPIPNDFRAYSQAYRQNGIIFACMAVRMSVFSTIRFKWQKDNYDGMPSKLFGTSALEVFETPWVGGTTQDLLNRMIQDADLCGNSYQTLQDGELIRLRPDWVQIILEQRDIKNADGSTSPIGWRKVGYAYSHGGISASNEPTLLGLREVAHFAPSPDPEATFRGQSWISSITPELMNDNLMRRHKQRFLENGATPNMVVSMDKTVSWENFQKFKAVMDKEHKGPNNAYKTLYLGAGADVKVVGANMQQMDFKSLQGHGETRIAAAAGVPPIIVGLSEGLESATYSNYGQARRRLADGTMHPLWQNAAGSLAILMDNPKPRNSTRLWYDTRNVPFLREDQKDEAEIQSTRAGTIGRLLDSGYEAKSVVAAVDANDFSLLVHTGLFSVQLQPPGTVAKPPVVPAVKPKVDNSILPDQKQLPSGSKK